MEEKKEYTVSEVIESQKPKDVDIPYRDRVVKVRIYPLRYGELKLMMRAKAGRDVYAQSEDIMVKCARKLEKDADGKVVEKEFSKLDISKLPPGFINALMEEINRHAGLGVSIEDLKKSYSPM